MNRAQGLLAAGVVAVAAGSAAAQQPVKGAEPPAPPVAGEAWNFKLTPYFWLGAMDGNVSVAGTSVSVDQSLSDAWDMLDEHLNFGACVHVEAEKGRWGIFADALYMDLTNQKTDALGNRYHEGSLEQFIGELGGYYVLVEPRPPAEGVTPLRLDLLFGARVITMDAGINPNNTGTVSKSEAWVDPIVGLRATVGVAEWLQLGARGDIGGFDIAPGTTSEFSWNVILDARFRLSNAVALDVGYRWLSEDYDNDKGGPAHFSYDVVTSGPFIGLTFSW